MMANVNIDNTHQVKPFKFPRDVFLAIGLNDAVKDLLFCLR